MYESRQRAESRVMGACSHDNPQPKSRRSFDDFMTGKGLACAELNYLYGPMFNVCVSKS